MSEVSRTIKTTVTRTVIVLESAIYADGKLCRPGEVLEVDSGVARTMIHNKRARRATPEEAAGDVFVTRPFAEATE